MDSRYKNSKTIYTHNAILKDKPDKSVQIFIKSSDKYYTVDNTHEHRLDLISYMFYGDPTLWWVIAKASNILNPMDVPQGTLLRIPNLDTVKGLYD